MRRLARVVWRRHNLLLTPEPLFTSAQSLGFLSPPSLPTTFIHITKYDILQTRTLHLVLIRIISAYARTFRALFAQSVVLLFAWYLQIRGEVLSMFPLPPSPLPPPHHFHHPSVLWPWMTLSISPFVTWCVVCVVCRLATFTTLRHLRLFTLDTFCNWFYSKQLNSYNYALNLVLHPLARVASLVPSPLLLYCGGGTMVAAWCLSEGRTASVAISNDK